MDKDLVPLSKTETETETGVGWLGFPRTCPFVSSTHNEQGRETIGGTYYPWYLPRLRTAPSPQRHHCDCQTLACALTAGTGTCGPYFISSDEFIVVGLSQVPGGRWPTAWYTTSTLDRNVSLIALVRLIALFLPSCHTQPTRNRESEGKSPVSTPENSAMTRSDMPEESGHSPAV